MKELKKKNLQLQFKFYAKAIQQNSPNIWAQQEIWDSMKDQIMPPSELILKIYSTEMDTNMIINTIGSFWLKKKKSLIKNNKKINKGQSID